MASSPIVIDAFVRTTHTDGHPRMDLRPIDKIMSGDAAFLLHLFDPAQAKNADQIREEAEQYDRGFPETASASWSLPHVQRAINELCLLTAIGSNQRATRNPVAEPTPLLDPSPHCVNMTRPAGNGETEGDQ